MNEDYYGQTVSSQEQKTVQERCREFYGIGDFVIMMNFDTEPLVYQVQRVENQSIDDDGVHQNVTNVKNPERIIMQPGETRLVPAYEADLMAKALIDKVVFSTRRKIIDEGETPRESVADPDTQRKYIRKMYQGKRDFLSEYNDSLKKVSELDEPSDNPDQAPRSPGRPAKQAA